MRDIPEASHSRRIARNILRDLVPCDSFSKIELDLGFTPASDDVDYAEHVQSHRRKEAVEPLVHLIAQLATGAAQVIAGVQSAAQGPMPPEQISVYEAVSRGAAYSVVSQLVEHGYLGVQA